MAVKSSPARQQKHLAVMIDAGNASYEIGESLLEETNNADRAWLNHHTGLKKNNF